MPRGENGPVATRARAAAAAGSASVSSLPLYMRLRSSYSEGCLSLAKRVSSRLHYVLLLHSGMSRVPNIYARIPWPPMPPIHPPTDRSVSASMLSCCRPESGSAGATDGRAICQAHRRRRPRRPAGGLAANYVMYVGPLIFRCAKRDKGAESAVLALGERRVNNFSQGEGNNTIQTPTSCVPTPAFLQSAEYETIGKHGGL